MACCPGSYRDEALLSPRPLDCSKSPAVKIQASSVNNPDIVSASLTEVPPATSF